ncbi:MAG TPA: hypothetical protein VMF68_09290 [Spirochaetia bacterium]|nr:hypothetical protein [Spirochaetia bacterium]
MRHTVPALVSVLLLAASSLPGLSRADLDRVIDFSVTLKSLATAAEQGSALPQGKTVLLSGTVSDVAILNKDEAGFKVRIELISGEWIGLDDVKAYTCYVEFSGPEYARLFPARPPREPNRQLVTPNSRVLVLGRVVGVTADPQGARRVLVDGAYIRSIE